MLVSVIEAYWTRVITLITKQFDHLPKQNDEDLTHYMLSTFPVLLAIFRQPQGQDNIRDILTTERACLEKTWFKQLQSIVHHPLFNNDALNTILERINATLGHLYQPGSHPLAASEVLTDSLYKPPRPPYERRSTAAAHLIPQRCL